DHIFLDNKFENNSKINKDISFDFSGVQGIVVHNRAVANPMGVDINQAITNPNTLNPTFKFKGLLSLPQVQYSDLVFIILDKEPTAARVQAAIDARRKDTDTDTHLKKAYQIAE